MINVLVMSMNFLQKGKKLSIFLILSNNSSSELTLTKMQEFYNSVLYIQVER